MLFVTSKKCLFLHLCLSLLSGSVPLALGMVIMSQQHEVPSTGCQPGDVPSFNNWRCIDLAGSSWDRQLSAVEIIPGLVLCICEQ